MNTAFKALENKTIKTVKHPASNCVIMETTDGYIYLLESECINGYIGLHGVSCLEFESLEKYNEWVIG
jgi:hypothetical protein